MSKRKLILESQEIGVVFQPQEHDRFSRKNDSIYISYKNDF